VDDARPHVSQGRRLIVGVGNRDRGDDAVGRVVAERLRACGFQDIEIIEESGEAARLLDCFVGADTVWLLDAAMSGAPIGTIQCFDVSAAPLPQGQTMVSTHGFGLAEAIELARALKRLPRQCIVYTVEIDSCEMGAPLTPEVAAGAQELQARICAKAREARSETLRGR
jgi:hydrogenase maturation protease